MTKLVLRESCFKGIDNADITEIKQTDSHKNIVKQTNEQIEKNRIKYAEAYDKAKTYFVE